MRRVVVYIIIVYTLFSFFIHPVYAQRAPSPQPDLSQPQQAQSIKTVDIHISQVLVGNGVTVHPGQPIGIMGSTGMSTGPHLEYQVRVNQNGNWITKNPLGYIN